MRSNKSTARLLGLKKQAFQFEHLQLISRKYYIVELPASSQIRLELAFFSAKSVFFGENRRFLHKILSAGIRWLR